MNIYLVHVGMTSTCTYVKNILAPGVADQKGTWRECKLDITKCSHAQLEILQGSFLSHLIPLTHNSFVINVLGPTFCIPMHIINITFYSNPSNLVAIVAMRMKMPKF